MKKYDLLFPFGHFRLPAVAGRCIAELGGRQDFRMKGKRLAEQKGAFSFHTGKGLNRGSILV